MTSMTGQTGMRGSSNTGAMREKIPKGYSQASLQQFTPEMMQLFQSLFSHLGPDSFLSKLAGGDEETFNQIEAPAMKQFSELQGGLASRFSGMGTGARKSSGFQNASSQAAADFAGQLQSQRQGLMRQALQDLFGMSDTLLNKKPFERSLVEKPKSFLHEAGVSFAGGAGQGLGQAAGRWATGGV